MSQPAQDVLEAATRLVESHRPPPDLPVDLAVHTALLLDGEAPCYTELTRSDSWPGALVFTLVTRTRVLQLTAGAADRPADGTRISTDVWQLDGLAGAGPLEVGDDRRRWLLTFAGAPPVRLPVAGTPTPVHTYAAASLAEALVPRPATPAD